MNTLCLALVFTAFAFRDRTATATPMLMFTSEWNVTFFRTPRLDTTNAMADLAFGRSATMDGQKRNLSNDAVVAKARASVRGRPMSPPPALSQNASVSFIRGFELGGCPDEGCRLTMSGGLFGSRPPGSTPGITGRVTLENPFFQPVAGMTFDYTLFRSRGGIATTMIDSLSLSRVYNFSDSIPTTFPAMTSRALQVINVNESLGKQTTLQNGTYEARGVFLTVASISPLDTLISPAFAPALFRQYGTIPGVAALERFLFDQIERGALPADYDVPLFLSQTEGSADANFFDSLQIDFSAEAVPEPSALVLAALGLLGFAWYEWRRRGNITRLT